MRIVLAVVATLLLATAAKAGEFVVVNKTKPGFVVVNKVVHATPEREFWPGYGWVEKKDGHWYKVEGTVQGTAPGVAAPLPKPQAAGADAFPPLTAVPHFASPEAAPAALFRVPSRGSSFGNCGTSG